MNASTIVEILEPLASVTWWRVLVRQSAELARLRAESDQWRAIAWKAARAGDDPARDQAFADESDRQAETYERLTKGAWSCYWTAAREIREHFPSLLESLPIADGIRADEIDPQAASRAVQGLIGKLLAVESGVSWAAHCELRVGGKLRSHRDTATTWMAAHPEDNRPLADIMKASKNHRCKRNREQRSSENPT